MALILPIHPPSSRPPPNHHHFYGSTLASITVINIINQTSRTLGWKVEVLLKYKVKCKLICTNLIRKCEWPHLEAKAKLCVYIWFNIWAFSSPSLWWKRACLYTVVNQDKVISALKDYEQTVEGTACRQTAVRSKVRSPAQLSAYYNSKQSKPCRWLCHNISSTALDKKKMAIILTASHSRAGVQFTHQPSYPHTQHPHLQDNDAFPVQQPRRLAGIVV